MDSWTRTYLGSLLVVLTLIGVVPAQDDVLDSTINDLDLTEVVVDVESSSDLSDSTATMQEEDVVRVVRLKSDGVLEGRVSIIQATGKRLPADAEVKFARGGEMVNGAKTNADGQFEVSGISPGTYTATAMIDTGAADFSVNVLPYDENAGPEQMILDATLTPTPEPQLYVDEGMMTSTCEGCGTVMDGGYVDGGIVDGGYIEGGIVEGAYCDSCSMGEVIIGEEIIDPGFAAAPCSMGTSCGSSCGFSGGGGCCGGGGGRGLGWLLGAGGLAAGITALAINDDDAPASPAGP